MPLRAADFPTDGHGWAELLPAYRPHPPLVGDRRVAWVIIGAGVTGNDVLGKQH